MVMLYAQKLAELGHQPTIFTLGPPHPEDEPYVVRSPGRPLAQSGYYFATGYTPEAQTELQQMDVLHAHHLWFSLDFAKRYGQNQPIFYTNHTRYDIYVGEYLPLGPKAITRPFGRTLMRWMWPRQTTGCTAVISPSAHVADIMQTYQVTSPIYVIPNGINLTSFTTPSAPKSKTDLGIPADKVVAAYVGRITSEKRILDLIEQFVQAYSQVPQLHLLLIGDGDQLRQVKTKIAQHDHDLTDATTVCGWVPYEEIGNYLTAADFFVTASDSEVHPLSAIEAMAARLPIAAPNTAWVTDTVPKTATLTHPKLQHSLIELAQNRTKRHQMAQAAYQASTIYEIDRTVQQTIDLYQRYLV